MNQKIIDETSSYYTEKALEYGTTPRGVDWNSNEAQIIRFDQISRVIREKSGDAFSICDYGCGFGDYDDYLARTYSNFAYTGYDVSSKMVEMAREKHPDKKFICGAELDSPYDYVVTSGIFNVRRDSSEEVWLNYILDTITMFNRFAKKGFSFNCLTKYSDRDHQKDYLYYADPLFLFDYCKTHFSRNVALLHDYEIYDFTILVRTDH